MEQASKPNPLLDLLDRPAFCVRDGIIAQANQAARQRLIATGTKIAALLPADLQAYTDFSGGCLYLTVTTAGTSCGASVTRMDDGDLFLLDQDADYAELKALALAAQQLRVPLQSIMTVTEQLPKTDVHSQKRASQIDHALHQLHRMICNMSDVTRYSDGAAVRLETVDIGSVFDEVLEKLATLTASSGRCLEFIGLPQAVLGLADSEMLERAVGNLVSNAIKFSPKGSLIEAKLTQNGNMLYFTLQDQGQGISPEVRGNIFYRYLREPSIEDSRHGMGLGMALVRSVAVAHGGTVLIDQPTGSGTRVTMTIAIRKTEGNTVRTPIRLPVGDYAGGRDRGMLELADVLPSSAYTDTNS